MSEFETEYAPGLPAPLPKGERLLWQGKPRWRSLAVHAFHVRSIAIYFAILTVWRGMIVASDGGDTIGIIIAMAWIVLLALAAIAVLGLLAWLSARSTIYTITDQRILMRFGIALPITLNIPFRVVDGVSLSRHRDLTGDIAVTVSGGDRVAYLCVVAARQAVARKPAGADAAIARQVRRGGESAVARSRGARRSGRAAAARLRVRGAGARVDAPWRPRPDDGSCTMSAEPVSTSFPRGALLGAAALMTLADRGRRNRPAHRIWDEPCTVRCACREPRFALCGSVGWRGGNQRGGHRPCRRRGVAGNQRIPSQHHAWARP